MDGMGWPDLNHDLACSGVERQRAQENQSDQSL
jgi:hypothetical protein